MPSLSEMIYGVEHEPLSFERLVQQTGDIIVSATQTDYESGISYKLEANGSFFALTPVKPVHIDERYDIAPKKKERVRENILARAFADADQGKKVILAVPATKNTSGGMALLAKLES